VKHCTILERQKDRKMQIGAFDVDTISITIMATVYYNFTITGILLDLTQMSI
jgi:hypothetical protein